MPFRVFISYARLDYNLVKSLHSDLTMVGHEVFMDDEMTGGQSWWEVLLRQIRSCDVFVPVLSQNWMDSEPCSLEARYAKDLSKVFLPVKIGDVPVRLLPAGIAELQWVDYASTDKNSTLKLVGAINSMQPSPPLPDPLPNEPVVPISYLTELKDRVGTKAEMSRDEQERLLADLRRGAADPNGGQELVMLLERFRDRDDLNIRVANDIDSLLRSLQLAPPRSGPEPPTRPIPNRPPPNQAPPNQPSQATHNPSRPPFEPTRVASHSPGLSPNATTKPGSGKITASFICAAIGILFVPIILGPIAFFLAYKAKEEGNPNGTGAMIFAVVATVVGFILTAILLASGG